MQAGSCSASQLQFKHSTTTHKHTHLISCGVKNLRQGIYENEEIPSSLHRQQREARKGLGPGLLFVSEE
jgi:hypothetical protein